MNLSTKKGFPMSTYIVIGAGILGASTTYHLAKSGANVMLVDRQDIGQATAAAAGIVCPWLSQRRNQAWYKLAKEGAKNYTELIKQLEMDGETDTGYKVVGAMSLHTEEEKLDKLVERAYVRRELAPEMGEISRLSYKEMARLFPPLSEKFAAVHISGAARVNGRSLRNSLINSAKKHGASFVHGNARILFQDKKVTGVHVDGQDILADQVIVTAGVWANELLQPLGIQFLVSAQKAQIVHLHLPETDTGNWPVIMPPTNQYMVAFNNGRLVIGATYEDVTILDNRVTVGGVHEILDKALAVAPGLVNSSIIETRVGFRPVTPGFLPVIGSLPNYEGLLIANGLGSSGLTAGPFLGSELAKLALGHSTVLDLSQYDVAGAIGKERNL